MCIHQHTLMLGLLNNTKQQVVDGELGKSESIEEGVMSNIHLMADASKDFEDFKKKFKKDYKKVFKNTPDFMDWLYGMYKDMAPLKAGEKVEEATRGEIHKAAKKGNYPATIVVSEKGKVVYQELVKTPQLVPAIFMILQKKYPNAKKLVLNQKLVKHCLLKLWI